MFKCDKCNKDFDHEEGLKQHTEAKHSTEAEKKQAEKQSKEKHTSNKSGKSLKYGAAVIIVLLMAYGAYSISTAPSAQSNPNIPSGPIHWHPHLTIKINGQEQIIPANVGINPAFHQPIHTHDATGTIHLENNNPTEQNMKLEFFFKVWGKIFNSKCIFDYCTDEKNNVKMSVNGKPNSGFENYFMKDNDKIVIEYSPVIN